MSKCACAGEQSEKAFLNASKTAGESGGDSGDSGDDSGDGGEELEGLLRSPSHLIASTYHTHHPHIHSFKEMAPIGLQGWRGLLSSVPMLAIRAARQLVPSLSSLRLFEWFVKRDERTKRWRLQYTAKTLLSDLLASIVVTCLLLPQSMSYALLCGAPVQYGLYTSVVPPFMYAIFTSVGSLQYGIVAPTSILSNGIVHGLTDAAEKSDLFVMRSVQLAFACGVVYAIMLVLRMSWLSHYLSLPVLNGFVWGSALIIIASQLKDLFNITYPGSPREFGPRLRMAFANAGSANKVSVGLGLVSLFLLLYAKDVSIRGYKLPKLTPMPLIVILVAVPLSWGLDLEHVHGVKVVGPIPNELPSFRFPFSADTGGGEALASVLPSAVILALVSFVQTLGVANAFTKKTGDSVSASRELAGCMTAHLVGCCFGSLSVSGGLTRSAVAFDAGAKTPGTGIFVGFFLLLAIKFLTPYLRYMPTCVLAAIVVSSTRNLLDPSDARVFWKGKKTDFLAWLVTVVAMLVLDVQNGLFTGIGFSLFIVLLRAFTPRCVELGRLPGTQCFVASDRYPETELLPGIRVFRVDGEICFGNVTAVEATLLKALAAKDLPTAFEAAGDVDESNHHGTGITACVPRRLSGSPWPGAAFSPPLTRVRTVYALAHGVVYTGGGDFHPEHSPMNGLRHRSGGHRGRTAREMEEALSVSGRGESGLIPTIEISCVDEADSPKSDGASAGEGAPSMHDAPALAIRPHDLPHPLSPLYAVILDCSRVVDVDANGAVTLKHLSETFQNAGVPLLLAALPGPVRDTLERYGLGMETGSTEADKAGSQGAPQAPQSAESSEVDATAATVSSRITGFPRCCGAKNGDAGCANQEVEVAGPAAPQLKETPPTPRLACSVRNTTCYLTVSAALVAALRHVGTVRGMHSALPLNQQSVHIVSNGGPNPDSGISRSMVV